MTQTRSITEALHQINTPCLVSQAADNSLKITREISGFSPDSGHAFLPALLPDRLGDSRFMQRHGLTYPYVAGAMANGISSTALVTTMAENGMIGFFGAGGLALDRIEAAIMALKTRLGTKPFGFNLIHSLGDPDHEMATVRLYLKHGIRRVSAAAFMRMTPALVYYRIKGIHTAQDGSIVTPNHVIGKVSRIEIARQFFPATGKTGGPAAGQRIDHGTGSRIVQAYSHGPGSDGRGGLRGPYR